MSPIEPQKLLNCLTPLLNRDNGSIKSEKEVDKVIGLMTKFSKKLVSKCTYVNILKSTNHEILDQFYKIGGWDLVNGWLLDGIKNRNFPLLVEIVSLLLVSPVTFERLKVNELPKTIKQLSKECESEETKKLAKELFSKWLSVCHQSTQKSSTEIQINQVSQSEQSVSSETNEIMDSSHQQQNEMRPTSTFTIIINKDNSSSQKNKENLEVKNNESNNTGVSAAAAGESSSNIENEMMELGNQPMPDFDPEAFDKSINKHLDEVDSQNLHSTSQQTGQGKPKAFANIMKASKSPSPSKTNNTNYTIENKDGKILKLKATTPITPPSPNKTSPVKNKETNPNKGPKPIRVVPVDSEIKSSKSKKESKEEKETKSKSKDKDNVKNEKSKESKDKIKPHKEKKSEKAARKEAEERAREDKRLKEKTKEAKKEMKKREKQLEKEKSQKAKDEETLNSLYKPTPGMVSSAAGVNKIPKIPKKQASFGDLISTGTSNSEKTRIIRSDEKEPLFKKSTLKNVKEKEIKEASEPKEEPQKTFITKSAPRLTVKVPPSKQRTLQILKDMGVKDSDVKKAMNDSTSSNEEKPSTSSSIGKISILGKTPNKRPSFDGGSGVEIKKPKLDEKGKNGKQDLTLNLKKEKEIEKMSKPISPVVKDKPKSGVRESDMFMMALESTKDVKPKKKTRRISSSSSIEPNKNETSPGGGGGNKVTGKDENNGSAPNFYLERDTLQQNEAMDTSLNDRITEDMENDTFDVQEGEGKLRGVLVIHRAKGKPKKKVKFMEDDKLVSFRFFEFDETERINVSKLNNNNQVPDLNVPIPPIKNFSELKKFEMTEERKCMRRGKGFRSDQMQEEIHWSKPIKVFLTSTQLISPKVLSEERDTQIARESEILQLIFLPGDPLPEFPHEPDFANYHTQEKTDTRVIPSEDIPHVTKIESHTFQPYVDLGYGPSGQQSGYNTTMMQNNPADFSSFNNFGMNPINPGNPMDQMNNPWNQINPYGQINATYNEWNNGPGPGYISPQGNMNFNPVNQLATMGGFANNNIPLPGPGFYSSQPSMSTTSADQFNNYNTGPSPPQSNNFPPQRGGPGPSRGRGGRDSRGNRDFDKDYRGDRDRKRGDRDFDNRNSNTRGGNRGRGTGGSTNRKTIPCKFYQRGYCSKGTNCDFIHDSSKSEYTGSGPNSNNNNSRNNDSNNMDSNERSRSPTNNEENWDESPMNNNSLESIIKNSSNNKSEIPSEVVLLDDEATTNY